MAVIDLQGEHSRQRWWSTSSLSDAASLFVKRKRLVGWLFVVTIITWLIYSFYPLVGQPEVLRFASIHVNALDGNTETLQDHNTKDQSFLPIQGTPCIPGGAAESSERGNADDLLQVHPRLYRYL